MTASDADSLAEWMKDVRIPSPAELGLSAEPAGEEKADDLPKAPPVPAEPAEAPPAFTFTAPAADTEKSDVTPIAPVSQTVHETTEAVPQQMAVPQEPGAGRKAADHGIAVEFDEAGSET